MANTSTETPTARPAKKAPAKGDTDGSKITDKVMPPPPPQVMSAPIIGLSELHLFVGVEPTTVNRWSTLRREALNAGRIEAANRKLPPSDFPRINRQPAWLRSTVIKWAAANNYPRTRAPWLLDEAAPYMPAVYKRPRRTLAQIRDDEAKARANGVDPDA